MVFFRCGGPQRPRLGLSPERRSRQVPGSASKGASEERRCPICPWAFSPSCDPGWRITSAAAHPPPPQAGKQNPKPNLTGGASSSSGKG